MTTVNQPGSVPPEGVIDADAFNAFEAAGWEHQAPTYDRFFGRVTSWLVDALLDAAAVGPGSRLLDVATGPGYAAATAAERGASVVGVDFAPTMIRLARQRHPSSLPSGTRWDDRTRLGPSAGRVGRRLLAGHRAAPWRRCPVTRSLSLPSHWFSLAASKLFRVHDGVRYDHSGQDAAFVRFDYS